MKSINWLKLFISVGFCQAAGMVGSIFTFASIPTWYTTLTKPFFNPPAWVFGPVWTILYTLMGVSLYLVWVSKSKSTGEAIKVFVLQLFLNSVWSMVFFGLKLPGVAFFEMLILWLLILFSMVKFYKINKVSAFLLVPYILWTSFAALLNYSIWVLNK